VGAQHVADLRLRVERGGGGGHHELQWWKVVFRDGRVNTKR
jgi:hypothetical protein